MPIGDPPLPFNGDGRSPLPLALNELMMSRLFEGLVVNGDFFIKGSVVPPPTPPLFAVPTPICLLIWPIFGSGDLFTELPPPSGVVNDIVFSGLRDCLAKEDTFPTFDSDNRAPLSVWSGGGNDALLFDANSPNPLSFFSPTIFGSGNDVDDPVLALISPIVPLLSGAKDFFIGPNMFVDCVALPTVTLFNGESDTVDAGGRVDVFPINVLPLSIVLPDEFESIDIFDGG